MDWYWGWLGLLYSVYKGDKYTYQVPLTPQVGLLLGCRNGKDNASYFGVYGAVST